MGLLDDVTKLATLSGSGLTSHPALVQGVLQLLGTGDSGNGLANVLQRFRHAGLGDAVSSWVGTGQNVQISPEQLEQGLGGGTTQQLAQSAGLSDGAAASALAGLLPSLIDTLTPDGSEPGAGQLQQRVSALTKALGL